MQKRTKIAGNKMQKRSGKPGFYFLKGVARVALELRSYSPGRCMYFRIHFYFNIIIVI
jgi:hypothetical protein